MQQKFNAVSLTINLMGDKKMLNGLSANGVLKQQSQQGFAFVECTMRHRSRPLPRVYDGKLVTMVRHKDERYQLYLKQICFSRHPDDPQAVARAIAQEAELAIKSIPNPNL